jgi:hypothetical protein
MTGGYEGRVLLWDTTGTGTPILQLSCSVAGLVTTPLDQVTANLILNHGNGFSLWTYQELPQAEISRVVPSGSRVYGATKSVAVIRGSHR